MRYLHPDLDVEWQTPVITEKLASELAQQSNIADDVCYLSVPWATIIDKLRTSQDRIKIQGQKALNTISELPIDKYVTVCQHYKFEDIRSVFESIGGQCIFAPHCVEPTAQTQPFPLYAPNTPDLVDDRHIWYSFVGAYMNHYMSDIRIKIFEDTHPDNCIVVKREAWQFNDEVYMGQVWKQSIERSSKYLADEKTKYYKRVLAHSRFSLCPSGAGPTSIRVYESLGCGAIPVIMADTFHLPRLNTVNWDDCVVNIKEGNYRDMRKILKSIPLAREKEMRHNCIQAYAQVSGENITKCIRDYYDK